MLKLQLLALATVAALDMGNSVQLLLPVDSDERAQLVAENLVMGSLAPHAKVVAINERAGKVALIAAQACGCFGHDAKADEPVALFDFINGTPLDKACDFVEQLLAGKLHKKVQVVKITNSKAILPPAEPTNPQGPSDPPPGEQNQPPGEQSQPTDEQSQSADDQPPKTDEPPAEEKQTESPATDQPAADKPAPAPAIAPATNTRRR